MTAGVALNGQINVLKSLSPILMISITRLFHNSVTFGNKNNTSVYGLYFCMNIFEDLLLSIDGAQQQFFSLTALVWSDLIDSLE